MPNTKIIFGPPGTGKTTKILSLIQENLNEGYKPEDIVYLSFTKKASNEGATRVAEAFPNINPTDFKGFSTIHSLCFRETGTEYGELLSDFDWGAIGRSLSLVFTKDEAEGESNRDRLGDRYREAYQYAKNRRISYDDAYQVKLSNRGLSKPGFIQFCETLDSYCDKVMKIGFHTMLERYIERNIPLESPIIYVDEAQDLSKLQWEVISVASRDADKLIIAGDDDQAIYGWAGACSEYLLNNNFEKIFLDKSYRIPNTVHKEAVKLISKNKNRQAKTYVPRQEDGAVERILTLDKLNLYEGSWYLLARSHSMLEPYLEHCLNNKLLFHTDSKYEDELFGCAMADAVDAVNTYSRILKGYPAIKENVLNMLKFMKKGKGKGYIPGAIKEVSNFEGSEIPAEMLIEDWGLIQGNWQDVFTRMPNRMREYLVEAHKTGQRFDKRHRITIGTIHSVKGGEADNVVIRAKGLNPDTITDEEEERRVWYVGITRTKKNLYLLDIGDNNNTEEII